MIVFRSLSLFLIVFALMLLGADLISTLEKSNVLVVRSLDQILTLLGLDAKTWFQANLPAQFASALAVLISWPGWVVLGVPGLVLAALLPARRDRSRQVPPPPPIAR